MILPGWQPPLPSADVLSKKRAVAGDVRGEGSSAAIGYEVRAAQQVEATPSWLRVNPPACADSETLTSSWWPPHRSTRDESAKSAHVRSQQVVTCLHFPCHRPALLVCQFHQTWPLRHVRMRRRVPTAYTRYQSQSRPPRCRCGRGWRIGMGDDGGCTRSIMCFHRKRTSIRARE